MTGAVLVADDRWDEELVAAVRPADWTNPQPAERYNLVAMNSRPIICLFAKPPEPGLVKTRLIPLLGEAGAAELAVAFLRDTVAGLRTLDWAQLVVATTGAMSEPLATELSDLPIWDQGPGDLGVRLARVLARALAQAPAALAVGADSPGMPSSLLEAARGRLATHDAVLGPAEDGGFTVLGLTRCPDGLLDGLPWSSADTGTRTRERLAERGLRVALLDAWFDVDCPGDLARLRALLDANRIKAPETARVLATLRPQGGR